jgi:hypothetical protein
MEKIMTPNQLRARAKKLEAEGGNRDLINKLLDDANDAERKGYEAGKKTGEYKEGGNVGMHRMPDGTMMKDSAHKGMKKGGKVGHSDKKKDAPMMQKVAARAIKGHEKRMHGSKKMAAGGSIDGCAVKGKTKGRSV